MTNLLETVYKPDVLSCLSDLSNDEVFTPPEVANAMLDLLPKEIWSNPNIKILDPACKSGVFLREAAKRFIEGEKDVIPDLQERIDHIMHDQLYGIAITELTSLMSRRTIYCSKYPNGPYSVSKFENVEGNIRFKRINHTWENGNCIYCGTSKVLWDRSSDLENHAYEFIHNNVGEIINMRFDVIISNPAYQMVTGGGSSDSVAATQAKPIFHLFVEQAKKLNPRYMSMIIPARWYNGGIGLGDFRTKMLSDGHLRKLVDYTDSQECFTGVNIAGGICYFLWDRDNKGPCEVTNISRDNINVKTRELNEFGDLFIRYNEALTIIHKINDRTKDFMIDYVYPIDAFGFPSKARGENEYFDGAVTMIHSKGIGYVSRDDIKKNCDIVDKYKVTIGILVPNNGDVGADPTKGFKSITTPRILVPNEITTFSYLVIGVFDTEEEATNFKRYMLCKFPRYMMRLTYSSMHISKNNFMFVPKMDFTKEWTDRGLYDYFGLSDSEQEIIERTMRKMDFSDGD